MINSQCYIMLKYWCVTIILKYWCVTVHKMLIGMVYNNNNVIIIYTLVSIHKVIALEAMFLSRT